MGIPDRFEAYARFLRCSFSPATSVADLADGHDELGLRPVVVAPRPATVPRWIRRTLRTRAARPLGTPSGVRA